MKMYCVKCRTKREDPKMVKVTMKNGKPAYKGHCPNCGTGMYHIGDLDSSWKNGLNTFIDEEKDSNVQLWNKLQELLPGTKNECPIRKTIKVQPLDPYYIARNEMEGYNF